MSDPEKPQESSDQNQEKHPEKHRKQEQEKSHGEAKSPVPSRVIPKTQTPIGLVLAIVSAGIVVLLAIGWSVLYLQQGFSDARMTGFITEKEFQPDPREEITLGDQGLHARKVEGDYVLTVAVPVEGEEPRMFTVWVPKAVFDRVEVGDSFDVGPYLVRE